VADEKKNISIQQIATSFDLVLKIIIKYHAIHLRSGRNNLVPTKYSSADD